MSRASARLAALAAAGALAACAAPAPAPYVIHGRAVCAAAEHGLRACTRQWPGGYVEAGFEGRAAALRFGEGRVQVKLSVDGAVLETARLEGPRTYAISGLSPGRHVVRVDFISESLEAPSVFLGVFAPAPAPLAARARQIELIGDSHTAGYANTSSRRQCSREEIWETTDASQSHGALLAQRLAADYQINAISGRGVVRNYDGQASDPLPVAYRYALFDRSAPADAASWRPEFIIIALGTNDFSTPLHAGEPWVDRAALHEDYQRTYAAFLASLRAAHPAALIVVWSADAEGGEIETQARLAVARARREGVAHLVYVPVRGLAMDACDWHPSLADHAAIADALAAAIEAASTP